MLNEVETGWRLAEFWTVVFPSVSIKDRPLMGLESCWTHALHLAGRIKYLPTAKLGDFSGRVDCPQRTVPEQVW